MIESKHTTKVVAILMAVVVTLCLCAAMFGTQIVAAAGGLGMSMEYENKLFDTSKVLEVNVLMDSDDWQFMLDNAMSEEYMQCDVEIGGQTFYRVGIRPKGNTSLSSIANDPNTDRYSFKLEFDQFVDGQTCYGLDKLILNNNYADATNMKEALIYDMFAYVGADASLYNYAKVSVNGEYWGIYLALEAVEDSFMLRNYGTEDGELYKPDSMNIGGGERGGFGGGMFGGGGANLNYSDDDTDSYSTIWAGEVTNTVDSDHKRVVTALKNISGGADLEKYMDIDNLLKYAAVHIFSVNSDSLSGSMAHNYYLYESDGQLNLIPWDYNLAFGGMGMGRSGGATDTVNSAIDDAWNGTKFFDTLMADETYHAAYYACMQQVVDYIQSGGFEEFYTRTRNMIDTLVETDPNAFYTYDEYLTAAETLYEVVTLRGEAIQGQIIGTIPSDESTQRSSDSLIDASHIDLSVMGSMNMGGGGRGGALNFDNRGENRGQTAQNVSALREPAADGAEEMPGGFGIFGGGELPEDFEGMELPEGFDPSQFGGRMPGGFGQGGESMEETQGNEQTQQNQGKQNMGNLPGMNWDGQRGMNSDTLLIYGITAVIMLASFLFALFYRRRSRKR